MTSVSERRRAGELRDRLLEVGGDDLVVRRPAVRSPPTQRRPEQAAQGVDVARDAGLPAGVQLGGHVRRSADGARGPGARSADLAGDPEVREVGLEPVVAPAQQHVGRLDVAVDQPGGVGVGQALGHLGDQVERDPDRRTPRRPRSAGPGRRQGSAGWRCRGDRPPRRGRRRARRGPSRGRPRARASRVNRARKPGSSARCGAISLSATGRSSASSRASSTTPMPPPPIRRTTR